MKFLLMFLFASSVLAAECDYDFTLSNATIQITEQEQVVDQDLFLSRGQNSPDGKCRSFRVFFGKGLANSYQRKASSLSGRSFNYNLHRTVTKIGILKDFGDALNSNEFLDGTAPSKNITYTNRFYISAPGSDSITAPSGIFWDSVQVNVYGYNENSRNYTFEKTSNYTVMFIINKQIDISLIDEGAAFDRNATSKVIDFGYLNQGQEQGVDLRVVSNTSYEVRLSSQNNEALKSSSGGSIDYDLKVNGSAISLSSSAGSPRPIGSGDQTPSAGDRYNLKVKISGTTNNLPAGLYQDVITITAIAK